jgi:quinolinate synthase
MQKARPDALLIGAPPDSGCQCATCPYMRLNTLEKLYLCLRDLHPEVTVPEDIRKRAQVAVDRMLALG